MYIACCYQHRCWQSIKQIFKSVFQDVLLRLSFPIQAGCPFWATLIAPSLGSKHLRASNWSKLSHCHEPTRHGQPSRLLCTHTFSTFSSYKRDTAFRSRRLSVSVKGPQWKNLHLHLRLAPKCSFQIHQSQLKIPSTGPNSHQTLTLVNVPAEIVQLLYKLQTIAGKLHNTAIEIKELKKKMSRCHRLPKTKFLDIVIFWVIIYVDISHCDEAK